MLHIERLGKESVATLRLKERSSFFDRALLQALFWSLIVHLLLFSVFRIRLAEFREEPAPLAPIAVSLEQEETGPIMIVASDPLDMKGLLTYNMDDNEWRESCLQNTRLSKLEPSDPPLGVPLYTHAVSSQQIASMLKKANLAPKLYPLQIKLSRQLKKLTLIEDGSSLFKDKGPQDDLGRFQLSTKRFPIEYKVTILGETGLLEPPLRKYELLDKELQECADRIIKKIRFAPFSQNSASGSITLTFYCSGEEVKSLMKSEPR